MSSPGTFDISFFFSNFKSESPCADPENLSEEVQQLRRFCCCFFYEGKHADDGPTLNAGLVGL